jgi:hypothetical protein
VRAIALGAIETPRFSMIVSTVRLLEARASAPPAARAPQRRTERQRPAVTGPDGALYFAAAMAEHVAADSARPRGEAVVA